MNTLLARTKRQDIPPKGFKLRSVTVLFLSVLAVKVLMAIFFQYEYSKQRFNFDGSCVLLNDSYSHYEPLENVVQHRPYGPASRMPGMLPIYLTLRQIFDKPQTMSLIVMLQVLFDAITVVSLGWLVWDLSKSRIAAVGTITVYSLSSFVSVFNNAAMMDSLGTATLILSVVVLHVALKDYPTNIWLMLACGLLVAWTVFLRQVHGVIVPLFILAIITKRAIAFGKVMTTITLLLLPLMMAIGCWATRNFSVHEKFVPLISSYREGYAHSAFKESLYTLIKGMGGDIQEWAGEASWFLSSAQAEFPLPERVYTSECGIKEMQMLRHDIQLAYSMRDGGNPDHILESSIEQRCDDFLSAYRKEHPIDFWILNRLRLLARFLFQLRLDNLPFPKAEDMSSVEYAFKGSQLILLMTTTVIGFAAALRNLYYARCSLIFALVPLAIVIVHPCVLGYIEQRYLCSAHPFLIANCFLCLATTKSIGLHNFSLTELKPA